MKALPVAKLSTIVLIVVVVQLLNAHKVDQDELMRSVQTIALLFGAKGGFSWFESRKKVT